MADEHAELGAVSNHDGTHRIRRVFELLVKQITHGLDTNELRQLVEGPFSVPAVRVEVAACAQNDAARVDLGEQWASQVRNSRHDVSGGGGHSLAAHGEPTESAKVEVPRLPGDDHAAGIIIDQHHQLVTVATRIARLPAAGRMIAPQHAGATDGVDDEEDPGAPDLEDDAADGTPEIAVDTDGEGDEGADTGAATGEAGRVWGASFALTGPADLRIAIAGNSPCPVSLIGVGHSTTARGFRFRRRRGEGVIAVAHGEGRSVVQLHLADASAGEQEAHQLEAELHWRARPMTDGSLLVHVGAMISRPCSLPDHWPDLYAADVSIRPEGAFFLPLPSRSSKPMHLHVPRMAAGHGCAVTWHMTEGSPSAEELRLTGWPTWEEPRTKHRAGIQSLPSLADLQSLVSDYRLHIQASQWDSLPPDLAQTNRTACEEVLTSAEDAIDWLRQNPAIMEILRDACLVVMGRPHLQGESWSVRTDGGRTWRPFQLLFFLTAARSAVSRADPARNRVDVIAFPTGGGKTEAYLLLSAFVILYLRRFGDQGARDKPPTRVLMRYPLRLLAAQQLQRAAAMTGKLSILVGQRKRSDPSGEGPYGSKPCYSALWAGTSLSPNTQSAAGRLIKQAENQQGGARLPLQTCPLCGSVVEAATSKSGFVLMCTGKDRHGNSVDCYWSTRSRIGVRWVDDEVYGRSSEFLVATLDKLAIAPWRAREVAGLLTQKVQLVIQDELHMLDDELGSLEGAFQPYLADLVGSVKIVAASATTANTTQQVALLYNRDRLALVPPPEIRDQEWFVARPDPAQVRTKVTGILPALAFAEARLQVLTAQAAAANLLQRLISDAQTPPCAGTEQHVLTHALQQADSLWTNLVYFGSRPMLRDTSLQLHRDVTQHINQVRYTFNYPGSGLAHIWRPEHTLEASSESPSGVADIIDRLEQPLEMATGDIPSAARVCLATSMIQVGVDVDRLGLMTFMGHPMETNSYIQAGGRIGRQPDRPGLTYVLYRDFNVRDRSIYEDFTAYHQRRNSYVEPALLAPFAPGALRRLVPSLTVLRYLKSGRTRTDVPPDLGILEADMAEVCADIRARAPRDVDVTWLDDFAVDLMAAAFAYASQSAGQSPRLVNTGDLTPGKTPTALLAPLESSYHADQLLHWYAPTSLRTVSGEVFAAITRIGMASPSSACASDAAVSSTALTPSFRSDDDDEEA